MAASHVLITGASSGIGQALAWQYAAPNVTLSLIGRDRERLAATAASARAKGAEVQEALIDVRDQAGMADFIAAADAGRPIDLAIANAGITSGLAPGECAESPDAVRTVAEGPIIKPMMMPMIEAVKKPSISVTRLLFNA